MTISGFGAGLKYLLSPVGLGITSTSASSSVVGGEDSAELSERDMIAASGVFTRDGVYVYGGRWNADGGIFDINGSYEQARKQRAWTSDEAAFWQFVKPLGSPAIHERVFHSRRDAISCPRTWVCPEPFVNYNSPRTCPVMPRRLDITGSDFNEAESNLYPVLTSKTCLTSS